MINQNHRIIYTPDGGCTVQTTFKLAAVKGLALNRVKLPRPTSLTWHTIRGVNKDMGLYVISTHARKVPQSPNACNPRRIIEYHDELITAMYHAVLKKQDSIAERDP